MSGPATRATFVELQKAAEKLIPSVRTVPPVKYGYDVDETPDPDIQFYKRAQDQREVVFIEKLVGPEALRRYADLEEIKKEKFIHLTWPDIKEHLNPLKEQCRPFVPPPRNSVTVETYEYVELDDYGKNSGNKVVMMVPAANFGNTLPLVKSLTERRYLPNQKALRLVCRRYENPLENYFHLQQTLRALIEESKVLHKEAEAKVKVNQWLQKKRVDSLLKLARTVSKSHKPAAVPA
eukprot:Colp12_sorted_trinity150504_noHs@16565